MATSRGSVTQPTAKSNGNQPRKSGLTASKGREGIRNTPKQR